MKLILFILLLSSVASAAECGLDQETISKNLKLDYKSFDQTMNEGWRALANKDCQLEAAVLLDIYHLHHSGSLMDWQHRVLYWHAGQMYAFVDGRTKDLADGR